MNLKDMKIGQTATTLKEGHAVIANNKELSKYLGNIFEGLNKLTEDLLPPALVRAGEHEAKMREAQKLIVKAGNILIQVANSLPK